MKHQITEDVTMHLKVDLPIDDLEDVIDKVVDGALIIIAASTAAYIFKSLFKKERS